MIPRRNAAPVVTVVVEDIGGRVAALRALSASEALYGSLVDAIPLCIYRIDPDGRIVFVNRALQERIGVPLEAIVGRNGYEYFSRERAARYRAVDRGILETGTEFHGIDEHVSRRTGRRFFTEITKVPVRDTDGRIVGIQGLFSDVTAADRGRARDPPARQRLREQPPGHHDHRRDAADPARQRRVRADDRLHRGRGARAQPRHAARGHPPARLLRGDVAAARGAGSLGRRAVEPAQGRQSLSGAAVDRRRARQRRPRHALRRPVRRHQRAQGDRGAHRVPGAPRRGDRAAEPRAARRPRAGAVRAGGAATAEGRRAVPRSRPVQERQRRARARCRRRAAAGGRPPAVGGGARRGHREPHRRRRVRHPAVGPGAPRGCRADRAHAAGAARGAVPSRRPRGERHLQHRHCHLSRQRPRPLRAAAQRRRGDVLGEGARTRPLLLLRARDERACERSPRGRERPAPGAARRRVLRRVPAAGEPRRVPDGRDRGAGALAAP